MTLADQVGVGERVAAERAIRALTFFRGRRKGDIHGMWDQPIRWLTESENSEARPPVVGGCRDHSCADRILFDISQTGQQVSVVSDARLRGNGPSTACQSGCTCGCSRSTYSRPTSLIMHGSAVSLVRGHDKMVVIRHQAETVYVDAPAESHRFEQRQEQLAIGVVAKDRRAIVPAPNDVTADARYE